MENGLYDLKEGVLKPHSSAYYSKIQIPVKYDPSAKCPHLNEFFKKKFDSRDITKAKEFMGYCLYRGMPIQKAFMTYGPGGSYKSTWNEIIEKFLDMANCSHVSFGEIGGKNPNRFAPVDMYNKLANICGDLESSTIYMTGQFKRLTSGKEGSRLEQKNVPAFDAVTFAKILFSTNTIPKIEDKTSGLLRRFEIIKMVESSLLEGELLTAMMQPEEMSGLFNDVAALLPELLERGHFTNALSLGEVADLLEGAGNTVETFAEKHIEERANAEGVSKNALYEEYKKFCEKYLVSPISKIEFGRQIKKVMEWDSKNETQRDYKGQPNTTCWKDIIVVPVEDTKR